MTVMTVITTPPAPPALNPKKGVSNWEGHTFGRRLGIAIFQGWLHLDDKRDWVKFRITMHGNIRVKHFCSNGPVGNIFPTVCLMGIIDSHQVIGDWWNTTGVSASVIGYGDRQQKVQFSIGGLFSLQCLKDKENQAIIRRSLLAEAKSNYNGARYARTSLPLSSLIDKAFEEIDFL